MSGRSKYEINQDWEKRHVYTHNRGDVTQNGVSHAWKFNNQLINLILLFCLLP